VSARQAECLRHVALSDGVAGSSIAQIASLAETRLSQGFIFRRLDSLPLHETHVEAPRPKARVAGLLENLSGPGHVFRNAFSEEITLSELSAAACESGRTALLEEVCRILKVTVDSLAPVIERPEHVATGSVATVTGLQQDIVSVGFHKIYKAGASAFEAEIAGALESPARTSRIAGQSLAAVQQRSQIEATLSGVFLALDVESLGQDTAGFGAPRVAGSLPERGVAARMFAAEKTGEHHN